MLEAQLAQSRAKAAEAEQASEQATVICNELRQQKTMLEVQLAGAKGAIALKERLAKLDKAVFGVEEPGQKDGKTGAE